MTNETVLLPSGVRHLRCDNPGPMTLSGTNTYVFVVPERDGDAVVVDPGPENASHRASIVAAIEEIRGSERAPGRAVVLLTHHHDDHEGGAHALAEELRERGHSVRTLGGASGDAFVDGTMLGDLQVIAVPGHTRDSVAFKLEREGDRSVLFSGDTVLGEGSSFVAYPDGDLTAYLASLDVLADLVAAAGSCILAPGHGPIGADAAPIIERYRVHRQERLDKVRLALEHVDDVEGDTLVTAVADEVYRGVDPQLRPAVEAVVTAQLAHLGRL